MTRRSATSTEIASNSSRAVRIPPNVRWASTVGRMRLSRKPARGERWKAAFGSWRTPSSIDDRAGPVGPRPSTPRTKPRTPRYSEATRGDERRRAFRAAAGGRRCAGRSSTASCSSVERRSYAARLDVRYAFTVSHGPSLGHVPQRARDDCRMLSGRPGPPTAWDWADRASGASSILRRVQPPEPTTVTGRVARLGRGTADRSRRARPPREWARRRSGHRPRRTPRRTPCAPHGHLDRA